MRAKLAWPSVFGSVAGGPEASGHLREMLGLNRTTIDARARSWPPFCSKSGCMTTARAPEDYGNDPRADFAFCRALLAFRLHGVIPQIAASAFSCALP